MRTSTVVFVVLFLCLFSSSERRSKIRGFFEKIGSHVESVVSDHSCQRPCRHGESVMVRVGQESSETRALRSQLHELERRDDAAKKTLRTVDRSVRTLDDRIRSLEKEMKRQPQFEDVFQRSLHLLLRQRLELIVEREEIAGLQQQMKGEAIRIQSEIDLARIRCERQAVESFLKQERGSPVERLADEVN